MRHSSLIYPPMCSSCVTTLPSKQVLSCVFARPFLYAYVACSDPVPCFTCMLALALPCKRLSCCAAMPHWAIVLVPTAIPIALMHVLLRARLVPKCHTSVLFLLCTENYPHC